MAATTPVIPALTTAVVDNSPANSPGLTGPVKTDDHITGLISTPRASPRRQSPQHIKGLVRRLETPDYLVRSRFWSNPFWRYRPSSKSTGPDHERTSAKISPDPPTCLITGQVHKRSRQDRREWKIKRRSKAQMETGSGPSPKENLKESSDDADPFSTSLDGEDQRLNDLFAQAKKNMDANQAKIKKWLEDEAARENREQERRARRKEERRLAKLRTRAATRAIAALRTPRDERAAARGSKRA
ncbi:hypothetical protein QBC40DRAFT_251341 [Triangularia verruculosa]|uniref:Uncharacterized protein n=1 Tax=Triangularia verruculosa TaxID=2587418 RepID=A0AAN7AYF9_9PEZI|nr:hypothetical protein QBC40DRAFT_251341 [Triangularia verruculosa]